MLLQNLKYEKTDTGIEQIIPFTDFSNILPSDLILELVADHWFGTLNQTCLNLEVHVIAPIVVSSAGNNTIRGNDFHFI
jgi:hypothetical protein